MNPRPHCYEYSAEQEHDDDRKNTLVEQWFVGKDFEEDGSRSRDSVGNRSGWKNEAAKENRVRMNFEEDWYDWEKEPSGHWRGWETEVVNDT